MYSGQGSSPVCTWIFLAFFSLLLIKLNLCQTFPLWWVLPALRKSRSARHESRSVLCTRFALRLKPDATGIFFFFLFLQAIFYLNNLTYHWTTKMWGSRKWFSSIFFFFFFWTGNLLLSATTPNAEPSQSHKDMRRRTPNLQRSCWPLELPKDTLGKHPRD